MYDGNIFLHKHAVIISSQLVEKNNVLYSTKFLRLEYFPHPLAKARGIKFTPNPQDRTLKKKLCINNPMLLVYKRKRAATPNNQHIVSRSEAHCKGNFCNPIKYIPFHVWYLKTSFHRHTPVAPFYLHVDLVFVNLLPS